MKYALNLADDNRILSATFEQYAPIGATLVDALPNGIITDYLYQDNQYIYDPLRVDPVTLRENAYSSEAIISWNGNMITVDKAVQLWSSYTAEGNTEVAMQLSVLITEAKQTIRNKYPDE